MTGDLGNRIQRLRKQRGLSLTELALRADVAKSYLSNVERNIQSNPSIQFLEKISTALNVTMDDILYEDVSDMEARLDSEWYKIVQEAMASGISKSEFREFLEFQKWKTEKGE